ncbi:MAG TPA: UDP-N-acetylmuramate dehydrogenase [Polyangiaceae bacterium]|nr:UDP-N-acetylmuramate dehydrogenase [Polyangiaceae bacterium]
MTAQLELRENVNLAPFTSLGVGGPARYFIDARTEQELLAALEWADQQRVSARVLGGGSNLVISDAGVNGLVVRLSTRGTRAETRGSFVYFDAAAGEPWDSVVQHASERKWAGIECLSGVPGSVGATPIQNVGAYGQDVSETIVSVRAFDRETASVTQLSNRQCRFSYRDSWFKGSARGRFVILSVTYQLQAGGPPNVRYADLARALETAGTRTPSLTDVRSTVLQIRRSKSMVLDREDPDAQSCGSFFTNPIVPAEELRGVEQRAGVKDMPSWPQADGRVKLSAAWLIERAGFRKGEQFGNAAISSRHSLAIVSRPGCGASDIVDLARKIRGEVVRAFAVTLMPEPEFWGFASLDQGLPDERLA